jgi:hypothetical protein
MHRSNAESVHLAGSSSVRTETAIAVRLSCCVTEFPLRLRTNLFLSDLGKDLRRVGRDLKPESIPDRIVPRYKQELLPSIARSGKEEELYFERKRISFYLSILHCLVPSMDRTKETQRHETSDSGLGIFRFLTARRRKKPRNPKSHSPSSKSLAGSWHRS